jgi:alkylation response protein AidB-like acyl-CoA dehydrogenase
VRTGFQRFVGSNGQPGFLTDDRLALQEVVRDFVAADVLPAANELDPVRGEIPMELRQKMADMGLFAILIPEEYGGLGLGVFEYCLVTEELARGWMSVASIVARANGAFGSLFTEEQRKDLMPRAARGEYLSAVALSEPEAGSDVANMSCRAERDGDEWVINGAKMWCTFADGADYILLFARTDPNVEPGKKHRGISAFLIDKERGSFPDGIEGRAIRKIGYHGWKTFDLFFEDFRLPASALVGEENKGFYGAMADLEVARAHTAARSIGLARGALEDSIAYVAQREQFGRPIGEFQAIRFKIAEMATQVEAARQLMYHVATEIDQDRRCDTEASMAKLFASEMSERVTSEALQIHGGAGYTTDFPIERYWRDARLTKIFEGTSEIQKRIISDQLLGKVPS